MFLTEYGKILGLASSYERALYFGNVRKEVEDGRQTFERLSVQFTEIKTGRRFFSGESSRSMQFCSRR